MESFIHEAFEILGFHSSSGPVDDEVIPLRPHSDTVVSLEKSQAFWREEAADLGFVIASQHKTFGKLRMGLEVDIFPSKRLPNLVEDMFRTKFELGHPE